jgi:hypothetical protein
MIKEGRTTAIICDDIRQEKSGKLIFVGVYISAIIVEEFPAILPIAISIFYESDSPIKKDGDFRVIMDESTLIRGEISLNVSRSGAGALNIERVPLHIQREGLLQFQWKFGDSDWENIKSIPVSKGPVK